MKNYLYLFLAICLSITVLSFKGKTLKLIPEKLTVLESKPIQSIATEIIIPKEIIKIETKNHYDFLKAIGFKESGNKYDIVNKYGYMGRYQFGKSTLKGLGFKVSKDEFLNSPEIQEKAMQSLLEHNKKKLKKIIKKYDNTEYRGIFITESGILAAAHLGGQGNVKKFFRNGSEFKDGFGTSILTYMEKFSGYQLDLN